MHRSFCSKKVEDINFLQFALTLDVFMCQPHSDTKSQILFKNSNPKKLQFSSKNRLKTSKFVFLEIWIYEQFLLFCITVRRLRRTGARTAAQQRKHYYWIWPYFLFWDSGQKPNIFFANPALAVKLAKLRKKNDDFSKKIVSSWIVWESKKLKKLSKSLCQVWKVQLD